MRVLQQALRARHPSPIARKPPNSEVQDLVREADLDWHRGWNGDPLDVNCYLTLVRSVERHCYGIPNPPPQGVPVRVRPWAP